MLAAECWGPCPGGYWVLIRVAPGKRGLCGANHARLSVLRGRVGFSSTYGSSTQLEHFGCNDDHGNIRGRYLETSTGQGRHRGSSLSETLPKAFIG